MNSSTGLCSFLRSKLFRSATLAALAGMAATSAHAQAAWVRVSQAGYESGKGPFRAYLMSKVVKPAPASP